MIELIIVIAIAAILMSMTAFFANGYINDQKQLIRNEKAELMYTNAANMLVDVEISQDMLKLTAGYVTTPSDANLLSNMTLSANFINGKIDTANGITIKPVFDSSVSTGEATPSAKVLYSSVGSTAELRSYEYISKMLTDALEKDYNGAVYFALDVENYNVQSVIFSETYDLDFEKSIKLNKYKFTDTDTSCGSEFYGSTDIISQEESFDTHDVYYGAYPLLNTLSAEYKYVSGDDPYNNRHEDKKGDGKDGDKDDDKEEKDD